jgi:hypothetical protein
VRSAYAPPCSSARACSFGSSARSEDVPGLNCNVARPVAKSCAPPTPEAVALAGAAMDEPGAARASDGCVSPADHSGRRDLRVRWVQRRGSCSSCRISRYSSSCSRRRQFYRPLPPLPRRVIVVTAVAVASSAGLAGRSARGSVPVCSSSSSSCKGGGGELGIPVPTRTVHVRVLVHLHVLRDAPQCGEHKCVARPQLDLGAHTV